MAWWAKASSASCTEVRIARRERALLLSIGLLTVPASLSAQGLNNLWMGGFSSWAGPPYGGTNLDFITGSANIYYVNREIDFGRTAANITDSAGNLLFATNGYYIANAAGDTMVNGTGLNPCAYTSSFPDGLNVPQGTMILPAPGHPELYYLFHGSVEDQSGPNALYLYLSVIDMSLSAGLGEVIVKNEILISDALNVGRITGVRHANGRDWWVFCHKVNSTSFYRMLVTPAGVGAPAIQDIGTFRPPDGGQMAFSPDGSKFAYYWGIEDLDIFDFDRCAGLFSNPVHIDISDYDQMGGVAFSPSSQFLYVSSVLDVYQYDVTASDIEASMVHIAEWDSFYSPSPPFATVFDLAQLAPDGKIYIATGNGTDKLHVINNPDQPGVSCDIVQHGVQLPSYFQNSLPNHPNYHLGPIDGSICDSLGINVILPEGAPRITLNAYPNPSDGAFTLSYPAQATVGDLEVRDMAGRIVYHERIPQWSTVHGVDLSTMAAGLYNCSLTWSERRALIRIAVER